MSNLDEDDELQPSIENELLELNKIMKDVDASLRTKILSEVESLIAKYRKCLINAVQGKKLYQMELEKVHSAQKAKIHKLRETNKHLEEVLRKCQVNSLTASDEKLETTESGLTLTFSSPLSKETSNVIVENTLKNSKNPQQTGEGECINVITRTEKETETLLTSKKEESPTLPKQPPDPETEPLGK